MKKKGLLWGASYLIAGLLIAIGPQTIFHVCRSDGDMVMRCFYTAQTELIIGLEITVLGIVYFLFQSSFSRIVANISILLSALTAFLIPNVLIGVCDAAHMHCNAVTRPALTLISGLVFILAGAGLYLSIKEAGFNVTESSDNLESGREESKEKTA